MVAPGVVLGRLIGRHDNRMGANGLKSDFGGHDNKHQRNIYAFVSVCFGAPMPFRYFHGFNDAFVNNTCTFERAPRSSLCYVPEWGTMLHPYG